MQILVNGACGRLGSELCRLLEDGYQEDVLSGAVDLRAAPERGVLHRLADFDGNADAVIDFSHHSAAFDLCACCEERRVPLVIAATGQTTAENARLAQCAQVLPVFQAANLSPGGALLGELCRTAAAALPDADAEIIELHHSGKRDAPSGTALQLAAALAEARPDSRLQYGRGKAAVRAAGEIGVHAVRLGTLAGTHSVLLSAGDETVVLTHIVHHPRIYALGALLAAHFLLGRAPGLYTMPQLLAERRAHPPEHCKEEKRP